MFGNSIATHLQYRHFMVNHFTNLICLDGNVVVDAEIIEGLNTNNNDDNNDVDNDLETTTTKLIQKENKRSTRYQPLNPLTIVKSMYILVDQEYIPDPNNMKKKTTTHSTIWSESIEKRSSNNRRTKHVCNPLYNIKQSYIYIYSKTNINNIQKQHTHTHTATTIT